MVPVIFVWMIFLCGVKAQVLFTVFPLVVEPGFTPSFTLSCTAPEQEVGQIQSISIFRRAVTGNQARVSPKETIAQLRGPAPGQVTVSPGYENITARGQITLLEAEAAAGEVPQPRVVLTPQQELLAAQQAELAAQQAELGTYFDITWTRPTVQDLGVYTCEVIILGIGTGQTLFAEVRVTTANPLTDSLLLAVSEIQQQADVFNKTLSAVQSEIDGINAVLAQISKPRNDTSTTEQATTSNATTDTTQAISAEGTTTDKSQATTHNNITQATDADLKRLADALEKLTAKFELFNETLKRLDRIILTLEERVEETAVKKTSDEKVPLDEIRYYFITGNDSYILFETNQNASTDRAQAVCESKRLHLAEIYNEEDFQIISNEIAPYVRNDSLVLVAGHKALGQSDWIFQNSQQLVTFFAWGPAVIEGKASTNECLAVKKSHNDWNTVIVSCPNEHANVFFLCQGK